MMKKLPLFGLMLTLSTYGMAQTRTMSNYIAPNSVNHYDGGYGVVMPRILDNQIINDSTVIQRSEGWGDKEETFDTLNISWIRDKYNVKSCDMYKKFFTKISYCYLDSSNQNQQGTFKKSTPKKSSNTLLYFILGSIVLYPACRKLKV